MVVARLVPWWCSIRRGVFAVALVLLVAGALSRAGFAAEPVWKASWITHPTAPLREPIVLHFRRTLQLDGKLARYVVFLKRLSFCKSTWRTAVTVARAAD
jgi:hypothetical protein